jgi:hypothetical protein
LTLDKFINEALNSTTLEKTFELEVTEEACKAIKKHTNLNICKYRFIIKEEYVRHIKNRRGQIEVSLVFRKRFEDGIVRMKDYYL